MNLTDEQRQKISLMRRRFVHQSGVFAHQWWNPQKQQGGWLPVLENRCTEGCTRYMCPHVTPRKLSDDAIDRHLRGTETVGVYQLADDDTVTWLCLDIDMTGDTTDRDLVRETAQRIYRFNKAMMHLPALLEDSTNKGMHVWFFFDAPIAAAKVMNFGRWIVNSIEVPDGIHVEVFPKQGSARALGNLVRMPLGIHRKTGKRTMFVGWKDFEPLRVERQWDALERYPSIKEVVIDNLFDTYDIPIEQRREASKSVEEFVGEKTPKCYTHILREGVGGGSRDVATFKLSCYFRDRGIPLDLAEPMLQEWNQKNDPPLEEDQVSRKVESAFQSDYGAYPCQEHAFDSICFKDCYWYKFKVQQRGVRRNKR